MYTLLAIVCAVISAPFILFPDPIVLFLSIPGMVFSRWYIDDLYEPYHSDLRLGIVKLAFAICTAATAMVVISLYWRLAYPSIGLAPGALVLLIGTGFLFLYKGDKLPNWAAVGAEILVYAVTFVMVLELHYLDLPHERPEMGIMFPATLICLTVAMVLLPTLTGCSDSVELPPSPRWRIALTAVLTVLCTMGFARAGWLWIGTTDLSGAGMLEYAFAFGVGAVAYAWMTYISLSALTLDAPVLRIVMMVLYSAGLGIGLLMIYAMPMETAGTMGRGWYSIAGAAVSISMLLVYWNLMQKQRGPVVAGRLYLMVYRISQAFAWLCFAAFEYSFLKSPWFGGAGSVLGLIVLGLQVVELVVVMKIINYSYHSLSYFKEKEEN